MATLPINLLEADQGTFERFLESFDHVFSDCDGVIWTRSPLPGAGQFFDLVKEHGKTVHFVSNNSIRSTENYDELFKSVGIKNGVEHLTLPSTAIVEYLKSVGFKKKVYCVACTETIKVLTASGFECKHGPEVVGDSYADFIQYLEDDLEIGAVVIDSDFKVNIPKIYRALTYAKRPDVIFINGAGDKYVPFKIGCIGLGPSVFTDIIGQEIQREPMQLAKPSKTFGELAMKRAGVKNSSRVLFIGDMIDQDVALGKAMGFITLLLLTTTSKENMLAHKTLKPDYYANSLESLVPLLATKTHL